MSKINVDLIRKLREQTGAPVIRVQKVLVEVDGNEAKAKDILTKEGFAKVAKRLERATAQGKLFTYLHHTSKVAAVVELLCETDFVARNELFEALGKDVAMQVASMGEKDILEQEFIKDPSKKISDLVKEVIVKTGKNVRMGRLIRLELNS